jgi:hypothetical protein
MSKRLSHDLRNRTCRRRVILTSSLLATLPPLRSRAHRAQCRYRRKRCISRLRTWPTKLSAGRAVSRCSHQHTGISAVSLGKWSAGRKADGLPAWPQGLCRGLVHSTAPRAPRWDSSLAQFYLA